VKDIRTIFIISDGTGETAATMIRAALVQYHDHEINIIRCKNVRSDVQIESIMDEAQEKGGFIVYTVVSMVLRKSIAELSEKKKLLAVDLLGPLLIGLDQFFEVTSSHPEAGLLRTVNEEYFKRIEAIEYTVKHDDGKEVRDLDSADIILVGISRTSKTPLSIFMSHKGWRVANVPLVLDVPVPPELFNVDQRKVVGLTIDPDKLSKIRRNRLDKFGDSAGEYASMSHIHREIEYAQELFKKNKRWPVFNVSERALEETASEIIRLVSSRLGIKDERIL
jgi:regulator of PEP synthase PpsR (kinase-PPPase family)